MFFPDLLDDWSLEEDTHTREVQSMSAAAQAGHVGFGLSSVRRVTVQHKPLRRHAPVQFTYPLTDVWTTCQQPHDQTTGGGGPVRLASRNAYPYPWPKPVARQ
jgi:hypothetical protein